MSVRFRVSINAKPYLGPSEKPFQLLNYIGGIPGLVSIKKLCILPGAADHPYLEFELFKPAHVKLGDPFLPHDLALMTEQHCIAISADEQHQPGVMAAGTALVPLRECLTSQQGGCVYKTQFIYQNMIDSNPNYNGFKGDAVYTFDQPDFPLGKNPFLPPDEFTVDHFKEEENPIVGATIQASMEFCTTTPCRFDAKVALPPFRFHKFLVPGQLLGAKKCCAPIAENWWERMIDCGIRRAHPDVPIEYAKQFLKDLGQERDHIEVWANAISTPCNYWVYFPDETDDREQGMITGEAFCFSSRSKCKIHAGKFFVPGQDCEDCCKDMEALARSFDKSVQLFKNPYLAKLQDYVSNWVFLQALCGVNGAQLSDGQAASGDPYANMGYHECGVLMRKATLVKHLGRINTSRPLLVGWADQYDPDDPLDQNDSSMIVEGTGMIDPRGNGYRNQLLQAYRYLFMGNEKNHFLGWKLVQWQTTTQVNDFYRVFLQFVIPELYDKGYSNASFVAMSKVGNNQWARGFTYQDLMNPHENMGIRTEVGFTIPQAKMLQKVVSFYPPIEPYVEPVPLEQCPIRTKLAKEMERITITMKHCNRKARPSAPILVADFFPAYHQLDEERIESICAMIRSKARIVDVTIEEEPITHGLGGYAVAFHLDITPGEQTKLTKIAVGRKLQHLPFVRLEAHIDTLLR